MVLVAVVIVVLVERWFFLVLQEYLQFEQPTEVESQVAAVVWLAQGGSLIRAAPEHVVACSSLDISLFEVANPDSALPGASWLRDVQNLRRTEYADLGNPPTESETFGWLGKIPMVENSNSKVIFSHHHQIQMLYWHLQLQNHSLHSNLSEILTVLHFVSVLFDCVIVLDGFLPQSDSHQSAHDESENLPLVRNEPRSSSRDVQPIRVDAPDHAVKPGDVEMQGEEFEVEANDENPNFQRVPDLPYDENPHVESHSPQSSEPRLPHPRRRITSQQFERNVRARQSTSSSHPVPSSEADLAFSADSLELACLSNKQWKKVGVEVSYPVTADMWISNDVIPVCQRAGIAKQRVMTMRWVHTWKVDENTRETKAKARLVVKGFTDPDLSEIRSESPTLSRLSRQLILQLSTSRGFRLRKGDVKTAFFLSGEREEARRDVYAEPPQEMRQITDHTRTSIEIGNCSVRSPRAKSLVEKSCS